MDVAHRLADIRQRIEAAGRRSGRRADPVRLVVVSKFRTVNEIREAAGAGVTDIGENRLQEAESKHRLLAGQDLVWHLVGRLQANKAKRAVGIFDWIHSVTSVELALRLNRLAEEQDKRQRVLVQVELVPEQTKVGFPADELFDGLERMGHLPHLLVQGLMLLPPYLPDPDEARPYFRKLRELLESARSRGVVDEGFTELSMGMSHDFEVAVEEGATMVRIGTAIFGERPASQPSLVEGAK